MIKVPELVSIALLKQDIEAIKSEVKEINQKLEMHYVTQQEFDPIRKVVYGLVGLILFGFAGALIALVLNK